jgi:hypothetical protein
MDQTEDTKEMHPIRKALGDKILEVAIGAVVVGIMSLGGMYLNSQIKTLQEMVKVTQELQVEVTRQGQSIVYLVQEVVRVDSSSGSKLSVSEAKKDREFLLSKIENNTKHIDQNKKQIQSLQERVQ